MEDFRSFVEADDGTPRALVGLLVGLLVDETLVDLDGFRLLALEGLVNDDCFLLLYHSSCLIVFASC